MAVLLKNKTLEPMALPHPLSGVLRPGQGIVLSTTKAVVEAAIGAQNPSFLLVQDVVQSGNYDDNPYIGTLLTGLQSEDIGDGEVASTDLANLSVTNGKLGTGAVTGAKIAAGQFVSESIAGQAEGSDADIDVTGIAVGDELLEVQVFTPGTPALVVRPLCLTSRLGLA